MLNCYRRIVLKQAKLHCSPVTHRTWANTRAASRKPVRIMLKFLINLRTLFIPIIPLNWIFSVILTIRITQINSNHSLGFCGLRTWPCVDAMQRVSFCWSLIVRGLLKHAYSLSFQIFVPLCQLLLAVSASSLSLFLSHTFTPYSELSLPRMSFAHQSNRYDDYEIISFIMVMSVFSA